MSNSGIKATVTLVRGSYLHLTPNSPFIFQDKPTRSIKQSSSGIRRFWTLLLNINATVPSHFCKFKYTYLSLYTDNHRVRGPGSQVSERLVLKISCVDVTSLPTRGPVTLFLFYRWKARVWTNIWTTMCGSTRVCWATGRHCVICHPEVLLQLSNLQANFCWDFANSTYKTIHGGRYGTSGERISPG